MLEGRGRICWNRKYRVAIVYIPSKVAYDSQFPFTPGQNAVAKVTIDVQNRKLIIEPCEKERE